MAYTTSEPKTDYQPSKKEQKLLAKVYSMFELARQSKEEIVAEWREAEALYHGHHWEGASVPDFKNKLTIDLIGSAIDTMIPILNSRQPKLDIMAVGNDPIDQAMSETLQAVMDEFWQLRDMQTCISELLLDYLIYGTAFMKISYNQYDDLPDCDVADPYTLFVNPSATKLENAEWVIYASPTPLYEIKRMYPNKGKFVKSDRDLEQFRAQAIKTKQGTGERPVVVTDPSGAMDLYKSKQQAFQDQEESVLLLECYMRDGSKDYMGDPDHKSQPGLRKICIAGNVLLFDGESKYPFFNQENHINNPFPFIHMKNFGSAHQFWGRPEPRRLKHLNLAMDRITSQIADNVSQMANPSWVVDMTADVQDQIHNKPGQIIRKRGAGQVSMVQPAGMPNYVFNLYNILLDMFETISGVNKSTQGKADTNVTSGVQADLLQRASSSKIDYKARIIEQALQNLGQLWLTMFKQLGTKMINVPYMHSSGKMEYRSVVGMIFKEKDIMVRVRVGSTLPENRQFMENKIMQLAQLGVVTDPMYIVENLNMPQKEQLLERMAIQQQQAQQQAMLEQQQAMAQAPDTSRFGSTREEMISKLKSDPTLVADAEQEVKGQNEN